MVTVVYALTWFRWDETILKVPLIQYKHTMKTNFIIVCRLLPMLLISQSVFGQLVIDDGFDSADWESTWVIQHNSVGSTSVEVRDGQLVLLNQKANQNGGVASKASFSPQGQGIQAVFEFAGVYNPGSLDMIRPSANGLFMGVVANNGAFYRAANNFGLTFFGQESRTASANGFGLVAGDRNGGGASDHFFDDGDLDLESFTDGCIVKIAADAEGWSYEISGVMDMDFVETTFSNSGKWADAGTSFDEVFGDDTEWHIFVSCQAGSDIEHIYDRIVLEPKQAELSDRDGDGMPDFFEEANGLNPDVDDADGDADEDGVSNLAEFERKTDPVNPDTDGDGLSDLVESGTGVWRSADDRGTNPLNVDSDHDGLGDSVESNSGKFISSNDTGTNPNQIDTDRDGSGDGFEVAKGSDPGDRSSLPAFDVSEDLIGHWKFDETSGTTASQSAPVPDNFEYDGGVGELVNFSGNTQWVKGQVGGALAFGGPADEQWVVVPGYPAPSPDSITVAAWVWADTLLDGAVIAVHGAEGTNPRQFRVALTPDGEHLEGSARTKNGDVSVISHSEMFPTRSWQHVAYVLEDFDPELQSGGQARLYLNGHLVASLDTTDGVNGGRNEFISIGALMDPDGFNLPLEADPGFWAGRMDDFGFWARALASEEIVGIYEAGLDGKDLTQAKAPTPPELPADLSVFISAQNLNGTVSVSWESGGVKLQSTVDLSDPSSWSDVAGATSPHSESADSSNKFFRVVLE
jgi:hypothetical protein